MAKYISSNANRFYVAKEASYGIAASIAAGNRFPAVKLAMQQTVQQYTRRDKTGSRTSLGAPKNGRRLTAYQARTYLTSWNGVGQPSYGPLFQAALGGEPIFTPSLTIDTAVNGSNLTTIGPHQLSLGAAVAFGNEIRFVTQLPDLQSLVLNAPFSKLPESGSVLPPTVSYRLSTNLPSITLYDFWDAEATIHRVLVGAVVEQLDFSANGDFHEFDFQGPAADVLDQGSFLEGSAGLTTYPSEPAVMPFDYSIVPGHLGQVWLGSAAHQFFTLMEAKVRVKNNIDTRHSEFGATIPRGFFPGQREVTSQFSVLVQDDADTLALYVAARQQEPISAMLQLGFNQGQLMGVYLPNVRPELPTYNDAGPKLQWDFKNCTAQGINDDELFIAFA